MEPVDPGDTMIRVRFTTAEFDADTQRWIELPVAELRADEEQVTISGPHADWISLDMAIIDPHTRHRVTRQPDPERWARLLPLAYRAGDIKVEVEELDAEAAGEPPTPAFSYPAATR
jgi:hypothetical protein